MGIDIGRTPPVLPPGGDNGPDDDSQGGSGQFPNPDDVEQDDDQEADQIVQEDD